MSSTTHLDRDALKRPDEFVRGGQAFFGSLREKKSMWLSIVALVVIAIGGYYGIQLWKDKGEAKAWETYYKAGVAPETERAAKWEEVVKLHPTSQAAFFAMVALADKEFDSAKNEILKNDSATPATAETALTWYRKALEYQGVTPLEKQLLNINIGETFELQKKWDDALASFKVAADQTGEAKALGILGMGRIYEQKNDVAKATEQYERVSTDYGNTEYGKAAKNALRKIKSPLFRGAQS